MRRSEAAVIAAIAFAMRNGSYVEEALSVPEEHLTTEARRLFGAIRRLHEAGRPMTPDAVASAAEIPASRLVDMLQSSVSPDTDLAALMDDVRRAALMQHIRGVAKKLKEGASVEQALAFLSDVPGVVLSRGGSRDAGAEAIEFIKRVQSERRLETGLQSLDRIFRGWRETELTIIAARTTIGKTAFALQLADAFARQGARVLYATLEMTPASLAIRIACRRTGVSMERVHDGKLNIEEATLIEDELRALSGVPVEFEDRIASIGDLIAAARARKPRFIFVDYLQLLCSRQRKSRYEEVGEVVRALKRLAMNTSSCVVALSQLSRSKGFSVPAIERLRDSGELEEHANNVILLMPDESDEALAHQAATDARTLIVDIAKQRDGMTGSSRVMFNPHRQVFYEEQ